MKNAKTSSQTIFYTPDTRSSTLYLQHAYMCKNCITANRLERGGGRVMEAFTVISPKNRGGGGGGGRNSEQGVTARQYGGI